MRLHCNCKQLGGTRRQLIRPGVGYFTYSVLDATLASDWPTGTPFHPTSGKRVLSHVTRRGTSMGAFRIGTCRAFSPEIQPLT